MGDPLRTLGLMDDLTREEHPHRIREMLESFAATNAVLSVSTLDGAVAFSSRVLRVGATFLDVSVPAAQKDWGGIDLCGQPLNIHVHLQDEASVYLQGVILRKNVETDGGDSLRVAAPESLTFDQRRRHRRLASTNPPPGISLGNRGKKVVGSLENISIGGLSMRAPAAGPSVRIGEVFTLCQVSLDTGMVNCTATIIHIQDRENEVHIGSSLSALSPQDRRSIERYMAAAERELIRRLRSKAGSLS